MPSSNVDSRSGVVRSVNLSERKTVRKKPGQHGLLIHDRGFQGDAHAGDWHRQVSLLALESIQTMRAKGLDVGPGNFAENITTEGIDLCALPVGTKIRIGDTLVELSQIGKICHTKCAIYYQAGDCVMPREGIFAIVLQAGPVDVGDTIEVIQIGDGTYARVASHPKEDTTEAPPKATANESRLV